jgi:predicted RNA binding protein YcfA (HicA-like mRNA interferase family)
LPAISGKQLIKVLTSAGWKVGLRTTHGVSLTKSVSDRTLVTAIPDTSEALPEGTLGAILGVKQTKLGKRGLLELVNAHGL